MMWHIRRLFLQKTTWAILGVSTISIFLGIVFRLLTPETATMKNTLVSEGNPDGSKTNFTKLTLEGETPTLPSSLWIGTIETFEEINAQSMIQDIISTFQLQSSPYIENVWINETYSLSYTPEINEIRLSKNLVATENGVRVISQNSIRALIDQTEALARKIFPNLDFSSMPQLAGLYTGVAHYESATPEEATLLRVPFSRQFGGLPVKVDFERDFPLEIIVDSSGELAILIVRPYSLEFKAESQRDVITVQDAIRNVELGNASIIDSFSEETFRPKLDVVRRGTITDVVVEYRVDSAHKTLIPYYRFSGEFVNDQDDLFAAEVITPAVRLD